MHGPSLSLLIVFVNETPKPAPLLTTIPSDYFEYENATRTSCASHDYTCLYVHSSLSCRSITCLKR